MGRNYLKVPLQLEAVLDLNIGLFNGPFANNLVYILVHYDLVCVNGFVDRYVSV